MSLELLDFSLLKKRFIFFGGRGGEEQEFEFSVSFDIFLKEVRESVHICLNVDSFQMWMDS